MEYLFLLYSDRTEPMTARESDQARTRQWAILDETSRQGILRGANPLAPGAPAACIRSENGRLLSTDGPYAETKEALGGFYVIDCRDADEAKYWAGRMAQTGCASLVEIRQLMEIPGRVENPQTETLVNA
jgi:hypothetical protein